MICKVSIFLMDYCLRRKNPCDYNNCVCLRVKVNIEYVNLVDY